MCESKKDPTVVQTPLPSLFSVDTRSLASLQCLSSFQVKEPEREGIQVAFSEMIGSASSSACVHELLRSPLLQRSEGRRQLENGKSHQ